jgi:hypothetical protein
MTTRNQGAPAQNARPKRTRIDESENTVVEIENSATVAPKKSPSEAALAEVKAAVALRPDTIQEVVLDVLKQHLKLKTKLQDMQNSKERMNDDAFIPRSARFKFDLSSSPEIMETEEFKILDTAMKADQEAFSKKCKERIMAVQELVIKETNEALKKQFYQGLKRISIMLMSEQQEYTDDKPCPYAKFLCWMIDKEDRIALPIYAACGTSKTHCSLTFAEAVDLPEDQETITWTLQEHTFYLTIRDEAVKIIKAVFHTAWATVQNKKTETATIQRLKKAAIEMIETEKTEDVAMEIDAEASADPKVLRDLINEGIKKATADLQKELNKLQQTVQRSNKQPAKNSNRGASSSQQSASSKKKTGPGQKEGEKKENKKEKGKKEKKTNNNATRPPTPRKQKRGTSPGRSEPASPSENKSKKKQTGGQRQPQKKGKKSPSKQRSW